MLKIIQAFWLVLLFYPLSVSAQDPAWYLFRIFDAAGNDITPLSDDYKVARSEFGYYRDSIQYRNDYYTVSTMLGATIDIDIIHGQDTMSVRVSTSLDSIPFRKGKYHVTYRAESLFTVMPGTGNLLEDPWELCKVDSFSFPQKPLSRPLQKTKCHFWKDYSKKIRFDDSLVRFDFYGMAYEPHLTPTRYAWNEQYLFQSMDKAKNWELFFDAREKEIIKTVVIKNEKQLWLIIQSEDKIYRSVNKGKTWRLSPDSPVIDDGATWKKIENGFPVKVSQKEMVRYRRTNKHPDTYYIERSVNKGIDWEVVLSCKQPKFFKLFCLDRLWVISFTYCYLISTDNGRSWKYYTTEMPADNIFLIDDHTMYDGDKTLYKIE
jgi:hypothetical protein